MVFFSVFHGDHLIALRLCAFSHVHRGIIMTPAECSDLACMMLMAGTYNMHKFISVLDSRCTHASPMYVKLEHLIRTDELVQRLLISEETFEEELKSVGKYIGPWNTGTSTDMPSVSFM
eukprot:GHVU01114463.1.p1 GENE.GHVU01114463.1~~GHVU01114463.1.p1  ORF type:complete len:119 (+),score=3.14 GHVU01114463.1:673-1029(+)